MYLLRSSKALAFSDNPGLYGRLYSRPGLLQTVILPQYLNYRPVWLQVLWLNLNNVANQNSFDWNSRLKLSNPLSKGCKVGMTLYHQLFFNWFNCSRASSTSSFVLINRVR